MLTNVAPLPRPDGLQWGAGLPSILTGVTVVARPAGAWDAASSACDVLLAGPHQALCTLGAALEQEGHTVDRAIDAGMSVTLLRRKHYRLLLLDPAPLGREGLSVLHALRNDAVRRPRAVVVLSAPDCAALASGLAREVDDYVAIPPAIHDLVPYATRWLQRIGPLTHDQPHVRIYTLGRFSVDYQGTPRLHAGVRARKASTLFKMLLTQHDRPVAASELFAALWPRAPETVAATDLRSLLYQLRKTLGGAAHVLEHSNAALTLRLGPHDWWDVAEFSAYLAEGALWRRHGNTAKAVDAYAAGLALYAGNFLAEDADAEWARPFRDRLREDCLRALEILAMLVGERGERDAQEQCLRAVLRADPFREHTTRALMTVLAAEGRGAEAIILYKHLQHILHRDLETDPDPETQALAARIRRR